MAIQMADDELPIIKEFADRTEARTEFWKRYNKMVQEGSIAISFYGAGGVGKTALLKKLEEELTHRNENLDKFYYTESLKCYYVKYDFSIGTDVCDVLKTFKFQLSHYGCKFPLFDTGNYYYSLSLGQDITAPRQPTMFEQIPLVQELKKKLSKASATSGNAMTIFNTVKKFFNATMDSNEEHWLELFLKETINGLGTAMPIMKTMTILMSVADMFLEEYMNKKGLVSRQHQFIRSQLNDRRQKKDPNAIYEYLPKLFARDVADWMANSDRKLVVFLDNYESLVGTTNFMSSEQRKRDWWLRCHDGLMRNIPNTLWTIAGRNKLRWDGNLAEELEQHQINELLPKDSALFLKKAGISDEKLLKGIVELTKGYPIFLDLCVDVYFEYQRQYNKQPSIEEFGQKREEVVDRILKYINENVITAKDMLEYLCVLNVWTDEIAVDIGNSIIDGRVAINFSHAVYELVKNVSFIHSKYIHNEDENTELKIFQFDKTIQSLIITTCSEKLIVDVKTAVNNYFKNFFADKKTFDVKYIFYLKLWAEFIVRFADDANKLLQQYKDTLSEHILNLTNSAHFDAVECILTLFMNKIKNLDDTENLPYTYFEMDFGRLRRAQGHYEEAYQIIKSAYENRLRLLNDEAPETIDAMHHLAILLNDLGRYEEAIKFHKQVLKFRNDSFGEKNADTIESMHCLAVSLHNFGFYDEALNLRQKVLDLRKKSSVKNIPTL